MVHAGYVYCIIRLIFWYFIIKLTFDFFHHDCQFTVNVYLPCFVLREKMVLKLMSHPICICLNQMYTGEEFICFIMLLAIFPELKYFGFAINLPPSGYPHLKNVKYLSALEVSHIIYGSDILFMYFSSKYIFSSI